MIVEKILSVLYGASGVAASLLYVPQVLRYRRDRQSCLSISLLSWSGWIVIGVITVLYATFVARNALFASVAGLNVAAQSAVLAYGIHARLASRHAAILQNAADGVAKNESACSEKAPLSSRGSRRHLVPRSPRTPDRPPRSA
jgi:uncharacterized sodium:solute symporter family permease YidK